MGTVAADEIRTEFIRSEVGSGPITIGSAVFPETDSTPGSVASFGESAGFFLRKSVYQSVVSSTATVDADTTVVGVNVDGPVVLNFPVPTAAEETGTPIFVVDESGLCSTSNTITASSPGAKGSLILSTPYSYMRLRKLKLLTDSYVLVAEVGS